MNEIDEAHVTQVCRPGEGAATCRYLLRAPGAWVCAKHTALQAGLDERVVQETIVARGDNCPGRKM
jgi:predicted metal-binding protein